jgi:pimeloyl-ACP methyl ester carboxylesterase
MISVAQAPESKWATLEGNKIHYYDTGNRKAKNAIVFIHGWSCNADFWKESYNAFPAYRVLSVDLLGHGKSDKPEVSYSMELFARTVNAVMENAKVKRAVLVGHSMGTPVARRFYMLFPEKTIAIAAVDMPLLPSGTADEMKKFAESVTANYPQSVDKFVTDMVAPVTDPELKAFIRNSMLSTPKHVSVSAMTEFVDPQNWGKKTIDVPVFVIAAKTPMWQPTEADFKSIAPKAEVQVWSDVSHFLMMERPALFNGQLKGYILRNKLLP